jgi:hypothetical protein
MVSGQVAPVRLKLKLHRLKPDGIGHASFVRLKLKLHRLKPDGFRTLLLLFRGETLEIFSPTCDRMPLPIRVKHVKFKWSCYSIVTRYVLVVSVFNNSP